MNLLNRSSLVILAVSLVACAPDSSVVPDDEDVSDGEKPLLKGPVSAAPLSTNRDRLLDLYAKSLASRDKLPGDAGRCEAWAAMGQVERGVFLTISHLYWLTHVHSRTPMETYTTSENPCVPPGTSCDEGCELRHPEMDGCYQGAKDTCVNLGQCHQNELERTGPYLDKMIDHIDDVYAVLDGGQSGGVGSCGGIENNRMYVSFDDMGIYAIRNITLGLFGSGGVAWRTSKDIAGPHKPFNGSRDTTRGQPRPQNHYFLHDANAVTMARRGVEGIFDPAIVETDIDYNWKHDSNPECSYGGDLGRDDYRSVWGEGAGWPTVELDYEPGGCGGIDLQDLEQERYAAGDAVTLRGAFPVPARVWLMQAPATRIEVESQGDDRELRFIVPNDLRSDETHGLVHVQVVAPEGTRSESRSFRLAEDD